MKLETYTITMIITVLGSAGVGMVFTAVLNWWLNRGKTKADTDLAHTQMYSTMINDLRTQLNILSDQSRNQGQQITNLQTKDIENMKIIRTQESRERQYQLEIKELKATIKNMEQQILELQNQIS